MILNLILAIENEEQRTVVEYIYDSLYDRMYQLSYDILQNHHDAEDAVMDAFKRIIDHVENFMLENRNETITLAVIYTRNAAKSLYKRNRIRAMGSLTIYVDEDLFDTTQMDVWDRDEDVQRTVINRETIGFMKAALDKLPEEQRDAILLKHYYGYRYATSAKVLGISENAARARVFRAKQRLKELLGDEIYERIPF